jgi:pectin methylesterase-like acyl-CoA thioesterase
MNKMKYILIVALLSVLMVMTPVSATGYPVADFSASFTSGTAPVAAVTLTVDDDGGADYTTIQAAVNAASSGDTIYVRAGTYDGFSIPVPYLSIIGEGPGLVTVNGKIDIPQTPETANATGTVLEGMKIIKEPSLQGSTSSDVVVRNCIFYGLTDMYGIGMNIENSTFENNIVSNNTCAYSAMSVRSNHTLVLNNT